MAMPSVPMHRSGSDSAERVPPHSDRRIQMRSDPNLPDDIQNQSPDASSTSGYRQEIARFAIAAAASKDEPTQNWNVVVPADRSLRTVGSASAGVTIDSCLGQARDADVQKAAEEQTDEKSRRVR